MVSWGERVKWPWSRLGQQMASIYKPSTQSSSSRQNRIFVKYPLRPLTMQQIVQLIVWKCQIVTLPSDTKVQMRVRAKFQIIMRQTWNSSKPEDVCGPYVTMPHVAMNDSKPRGLKKTSSVYHFPLNPSRCLSTAQRFGSLICDT